MRVRPFFWGLLVLSCISVLIFAATICTRAPAIMRVRIDQQSPVASQITTLQLHLTDTQGLPIEQAQVVLRAWMTNMVMVTKQIWVEPLGKGIYVAQFQLHMAGPWKISIEARADGFESQERTLLVQVGPTNGENLPIYQA